MKFENIKAGMVLYEVSRHRMGNTTMSTLGTYHVRVMEVDADRRRALVSWNSNRPEWHGESYFAKLKAEPPILIRSGMGYYRRPTKEERAAIIAERKAKAKGPASV